LLDSLLQEIDVLLCLGAASIRLGIVDTVLPAGTCTNLQKSLVG